MRAPNSTVVCPSSKDGLTTVRRFQTLLARAVLLTILDVYFRRTRIPVAFPDDFKEMVSLDSFVHARFSTQGKNPAKSRTNPTMHNHVLILGLEIICFFNFQISLTLSFFQTAVMLMHVARCTSNVSKLLPRDTGHVLGCKTC
jgi:hypothetical protein